MKVTRSYDSVRSESIDHCATVAIQAGVNQDQEPTEVSFDISGDDISILDRVVGFFVVFTQFNLCQ